MSEAIGMLAKACASLSSEMPRGYSLADIPGQAATIEAQDEEMDGALRRHATGGCRLGEFRAVLVVWFRAHREAFEEWRKR